MITCLPCSNFTLKVPKYYSDMGSYRCTLESSPRVFWKPDTLHECSKFVDSGQGEQRKEYLETRGNNAIVA
jgi:hypothetical protein